MSTATIVQKQAFNAIRKNRVKGTLTRATAGTYDPTSGGIILPPPTPIYTATVAVNETFTPSGTTGPLQIGGVTVQASPLPAVNFILRMDAITQTITNLHLHSEDLTTWTSGGGTTTATATTITDTDATNASYRSMTSPVPGNSAVLLQSSWVAKNAPNIVCLQATLTGGTPVTISIGIDTVAGTWSPQNGAAQFACVRIDDAGDGLNWKVSIFIQNNGTNTSFVTTFYPAFAASLTLPNQTSDGTRIGTAGLTKVQLEVMPVSHFFMACEGDSITYNGTYPAYPNMLGFALGFNVFDFALTGATTAQMLTRYGTYKGNGYTHFSVLGGVNDAAALVPAATIQSNLAAMWDDASARGIAVLCMTITPWKGSAAWTTSAQAITDAVNAWIPTYAKSKGYAFVDVNALLVDPANANTLLPAYDSGDHIHPNAVGRQVIAKAIVAAFGLPLPQSTYIPTVAAAVSSSVSNSVATPLVDLPRTNLFTNPQLAGGGFTPTGWTALVGTGVSTPQASDLVPGAIEYTQTSDGTTRPAFYQSIILAPNTVTTISTLLKYVSALNLQAQNFMGAGSYPAGSTQSWPACSGNPVGGSAGNMCPGELKFQVATGATGGTILMRIGMGAINPQAGTVTFVAPQAEAWGTRSAFNTSSVTDYAIAGATVTLGQTASGTYKWSGVGTLNTATATPASTSGTFYAIVRPASKGAIEAFDIRFANGTLIETNLRSLLIAAKGLPFKPKPGDVVTGIEDSTWTILGCTPESFMGVDITYSATVKR